MLNTSLVMLFVLQWWLWGLEWSTEDHLCSVRKPILWELGWLWQSLGWSKERLDQPSDQQVCPGSMLRCLFRKKHPWHTHTAAISACYLLRSTLQNCWREQQNTTRLCSLKRSLMGNPRNTNQARTRSGQLPYVHCWHVSAFTRWWSHTLNATKFSFFPAI